ncbi:MAG TPA: class I SAM-dependent methyltransferase [Mycobacteriales bacterium]
MDPQRIVRDGYDAIGERYHAWSHAAPTRIAYVERLRDRLAPGSLVLELGSGPGDPATRMLAERHRVVAVDLSWRQIEIARQKAPGASFVQADMTRLAVRPGSVDAVASFFATGHVPSAEQPAFYRRVGSWLRPGGVLLTTAPRTPGDGTEEGWLGAPEMFFGGIGRDAAVAALEAGGLTVETVDDVDEGDGERFLWIIAERRMGTPRPSTS